MEATFFWLREKAVVETAKSNLRIVRYFLAAGFLVPCLLYLTIVVGDVRIEGWWIFIPWPTFALIMSAEAGGGTAGQAIAFLISAATNVAVYGLIGGLASLCYRRYFSRAN
jgi:hypothetical protein